MKRIIVVTNNPLLKEKEDVLFVEGGFRDVLVKVRDMVYEGYELISHPLFASNGMMLSPYRTILMGPKMDEPSDVFSIIIGDSIVTYDKATSRRHQATSHLEDYAYVDESLYQSALEEYERLRTL